MGWTQIRDIRSDGLTDGWAIQRLHAPPTFFGEHKHAIYYENAVSRKPLTHCIDHVPLQAVTKPNVSITK
jgi:hypothetical protein